MLFSSLLRKVMTALRLGLPVDSKTLRAVEHMLKKRDRVSKITARAMVATLLLTAKDPQAFKRDLTTVELILSQWMKRILEGKEEFYTKREKAKLVEVLKRNNFPKPERFVNKLIVSFAYDTGEHFLNEINVAREKAKAKREEKVKEKAEERVREDGKKKAKLHA